MRFPLFSHPTTGKRDVLVTVTILICCVCAAKFLFEGISFTLFGHIISLGHADSMSYGAMLGPTLGAHGAVEFNRVSNQDPNQPRVDDPDGN